MTTAGSSPHELASRLTTDRHNKHPRVGGLGKPNHPSAVLQSSQDETVCSVTSKTKFPITLFKKNKNNSDHCHGTGGESTGQRHPPEKAGGGGASQPLPRGRRHRTRPAGLALALPVPLPARRARPRRRDAPRESSASLPSPISSRRAPQIGVASPRALDQGGACVVGLTRVLAAGAWMGGPSDAGGRRRWARRSCRTGGGAGVVRRTVAAPAAGASTAPPRVAEGKRACCS